MSRKEEFESLLSSIANAPVSFAGGESAVRVGAVSEEDILEEIRRAERRRKRDPSLFSGDPDGVFTYDDPVLAIAAYLYQAHTMMASVVGIAGVRGEELRNDSYLRWLRVAVYTWLTLDDSAYLTLMGKTPRKVIKFDKPVVRIAVTGDAGYSGQAQSNVLYSVRQRHAAAPFDLLIHLGDIYFAGHSEEMLNNFLGPFMSAGPQVVTLVGNHDLYFGGDAFLSALKILKQPGRYFCVETPHWRVVCLDTALPAPKPFRHSGRLDEGQLDWLDELLEAGDGKKTLLMSHHYIISGWGKPSKVLRRQIAPRLNKIFAWYWGHEHNCATYDRKAAGCYGACVGNGAFLEVRKAPGRQPSPDWYAQGNCSCYQNNSKFWPHGYLELELHPTKIVENYHLEGGESHVRHLKRG